MTTETLPTESGSSRTGRPDVVVVGGGGHVGLPLSLMLAKAGL